MIQTLTSHSRRLSWIALLAVFGLVFAPGISRLQGQSSWNEVCSADASRTSAATRGGSPTDPAPDVGAVMLDHCALCALGHVPLLAPQVWALAPGEQSARLARPPLPRTAPPPQLAWASAQPRAPPALS